MKAILVIDMPQNCGVCPISEYIWFENGKAKADEGGNCPIANNYIEKWNERPLWCPLRPIPEKQVNKPNTGGFTRGFTYGWNECIRRNFGETE